MSTELEETFFISEEEEGERLDKILAKRLHALGSRTYFQFRIEEQRVLLEWRSGQKTHAP